MARTRSIENSLFAYSKSWVESLVGEHFYRTDQLDVGVDTVAVYRDSRIGSLYCSYVAWARD